MTPVDVGSGVIRVTCSTAPGWGEVFVSRGLLVVALVVAGGSAYANLAHAVADKGDYRYFPPFRAGYNRNMVDHLGAEYLSIARALCAGRGFADPFDRPTGPTAWMPPVLPCLLAAAWWATGGDLDAVTDVFVALHCAALVWTGAFVLYAWRRDRPRAGAWLPVGLLVLGMAADFRLAFQITHDHFLALSALNGLVLWAGWGRPLGTRARSVGWGLFGGLAALAAPALGLVWAGLTVARGARDKAAARVGLAALGAAVALAPWAARNYAAFGRLIPVKSNLNFELYQSHCMYRDGVLTTASFARHPIRAGSEQAREYDELGEAAFMARKGEQFRAAVRADPGEFAARVGDRFVSVVLWYTPRDRSGEREFAPGVWLARALYPLPWAAVLAIALSIGRRPTPGERAVALAAVLYVLPYILIGHVERYSFPLLGLRVLLISFLVNRLVNGLRFRKAVPDIARQGELGGDNARLQ
jgi:hypothetical protein